MLLNHLKNLFSGNFDMNNSFEILTDSSSDEDLPHLSRPRRKTETSTDNTENGTSSDDNTLPIAVNVTFHYKHNVIVESFPNNAKGSVSNISHCTVNIVTTVLYH